ncbi:hypothetical protein RRG08_032744 [Elysia crispata]|uniref:Uncharacterized protein n=1 Tax=Elysia crispata TaxID=231223 RepID=A0AAE0YUI2_9GAST|nr:hypothetical protein RRG08_032744 [Elysia crispata]
MCYSMMVCYHYARLEELDMGRKPCASFHTSHVWIKEREVKQGEISGDNGGGASRETGLLNTAHSELEELDLVCCLLVRSLAITVEGQVERRVY